MEYSIYRDVFTQFYYATLLGGEFPNCYGQGSTLEMSVVSLKIRLNQLRYIRDNRDKLPKCYQTHSQSNCTICFPANRGEQLKMF